MIQQSKKLNLSLPALQKRSKQLDAREAYIVSLENLNQDLISRIDSLKHQEKTLGSKLEVLTRQESDKRLVISSYNKRAKQLDDIYDKKVENYRLELTKQQKSIEELENKYQLTKTKLNDIDNLIGERTSYQRQQEVVISQTIEAGNHKFQDISYEIIEAKHILKNTKVEIRSLVHDRGAINHDLSQARLIFEKEDQIAQKASEDIKQQIAELIKDKLNKEQQLKTIEDKYRSISMEIDRKLQILDVKERQIIARRTALATEEEEMREKRHRWTSASSLYEIE